MRKQRRSNSIGRCTLPAIPEYPGFQDIKLPVSYSGTPLFWHLRRREKTFSAQCPNAASSACFWGGSSGSCLKGYQTTSSGFHDKPLQEYFDERLMELKNYESRRASRKPRGFAGEKQDPLRSCRGCWCRSSFSAVTLSGHCKETEASCEPEHRANKALLQWDGQEQTQKVLAFYKCDYLDIFTMHIIAPLEAFLRKKKSYSS